MYTTLIIVCNVDGWLIPKEMLRELLWFQRTIANGVVATNEQDQEIATNNDTRLYIVYDECCSVIRDQYDEIILNIVDTNAFEPTTAIRNHSFHEYNASYTLIHIENNMRMTIHHMTKVH
jgi:hypothetical protein